MSAVPVTPRCLPSPNQPPAPPGGGPPSKTLTRWDTFIGDIASGLELVEAMNKCYITRANIETMCRLDDGGLQRQRWHDARLAARKSKMNELDLEEFFGRIASGLTIKEAQVEVFGAANRHMIEVITADADLYARYKRALEARTLVVVEDVLVDVRDRTRDIIVNDKGPAPNMAAVSRDKLIAETTMRVVGSWNTKMYGEKKDQVAVQVNLNLGEKLEAARNRDKLRETRVTPKQMQSAVDAVFSEKPEPPPTEWVDEPEESKPLDTVWREEQ
jgi:hypothetical protein